jgi:hypothetical protein
VEGLLVSSGSSGAAVRESNIVPIKDTQWRLAGFLDLGRHSVAGSFFLSPAVMQTPPGSHGSLFDSTLLHVVIPILL